MTKLTGYPSVDMPNEKGANFFEKNPIIPNTNIYTLIKLLSMFYKEKTAVSCFDVKASYGQLIDHDAVAISLALKELGVAKGQIVAISMPNFYQAVSSFIACNRIGVIATFLDNEASIEETSSYLNEFESPILINFDKNDEYNRKIIKETKVNYIITLKKENLNNLDINQDYHITSNKSISLDFNSLGSIAKLHKYKLEKPHFSNEDAMILFTSGSTGKPKSVLLTNKNIIAAEIYAKNTSHTKNIKGPKTLTCVPLRYPYSSITSLLTTLLWGKEAILAPDIGPKTISHYMSLEPNIIFGSPALLELIMRNIKDDQDLSSVTHFISGGDFLTVPQHQRGIEFFSKHGANKVEIGDGFGNAETVSIQSTPVGVKSKIGTAGKLLVGTKYILINQEIYDNDIKMNLLEKFNNYVKYNEDGIFSINLIDDNNDVSLKSEQEKLRELLKEKKYNEEGLLCVKGDHVFKEYYKNKSLSNDSKIIVNGKEYFVTGTLGKIDEDGYFTVTGRMSRFYIMSSLFKVYLDHVQAIISELKCVRDCAVVAVPDEYTLFSNKVFIVLNEGYEASEELKKQIYDIFTGDNSLLKTYEVPKYLEFVDDLPRKKGTEKIDYSLLTEEAKKLVLKK